MSFYSHSSIEKKNNLQELEKLVGRPKEAGFVFKSLMKKISPGEKPSQVVELFSDLRKSLSSDNNKDSSALQAYTYVRNSLGGIPAMVKTFKKVLQSTHDINDSVRVMNDLFSPPRARLSPRETTPLWKYWTHTTLQKTPSRYWTNWMK